MKRDDGKAIKQSLTCQLVQLQVLVPGGAAQRGFNMAQPKGTGSHQATTIGSNI
jgi:hypothetical protein